MGEPDDIMVKLSFIKDNNKSKSLRCGGDGVFSLSWLNHPDTLRQGYGCHPPTGGELISATRGYPRQQTIDTDPTHDNEFIP
jgi:hypothetical protein